MRILVKGGVWKNTEDEVLKAAVMKYGKNQWARVASLLNRKTAKQCKARWYEWLDPSIKKTEWSKEEEEKLLHLAKLMPNQWRTIAPIVGRTAGQCMDHYERLLDQAQEDMEAADASDDPRRLRPGEIDPTPETKPARPDPIDMDEDEKEMLSEAKARLANTKGKKAKRKARERQLEEARRLSMLQKRRELKAAGIESKLGGLGKRKQINYAREIPFQKVVPAGFYDVTEEDYEAKKLKMDPKLQGIELAKLEGRHEAEDEARERQRDKKVLKNLFKENAPLAVMKISQENDPSTQRKRLPLSLPSPQVSDVELEDIVKLSSTSNAENLLTMGPPEGVPHVTQSLVGDYSQQFVKPVGVPNRTPVQEDVLRQEAKNLRGLREMAPLFGNDLPEMYEGTGFDGAAPRSSKQSTPNSVLGGGASVVHGGESVVTGRASQALVSRAGGAAAAAATGSGSVVTQRTLRDHFGLNSTADATPSPYGHPSHNHDQFDNMSVSDVTSIASVSVMRDPLREKQLRDILAKQLHGLPEPEYTYDVNVPDAAHLEEQRERSIMEDKPRDAAEVRAAVLAAQRQKEQEELARRSSVLKRVDLPRPLNIDGAALAQPLALTVDGHKRSAELLQASQAIQQEMVRLLQHDAFKYPVDASNKSATAKVTRTKPVELEVISDDLLQQARDMIAEEARTEVESEQGQEFIQKGFGEVWDEVWSPLMFLPNEAVAGGGVLGVPKNKNELLTALMTQYAALRGHYEKVQKKVSKLETKLTVATQGYAMREQALQKNINSAFEQNVRVKTELECVQRLRDQESKALNNRLVAARVEAVEAEKRDREAQTLYTETVSYARRVGLNV